ncbi:MAG: Crp/Fnr family transcriptional regulator [Terriglobales bacterium]
MSAPYGLDLVKSCVGCQLRSPHFFCALPRSSLLNIEKSSFRTIYPKGSPLFIAGHAPTGVHLVCAGKVGLTAPTRRHAGVTVRVAGAGEVLGLHSCIGGTAHEFSAMTLQACETLFLRADDLLRMVEEDKAVCFRAAEAVARAYDSAGDMAFSLAHARSAGERLARFLLEFAQVRNGDRGEVRAETQLTHNELAEALGMARETLWRTMRELRLQHVASMQGQLILIEDVDALRRLAGGANGSSPRHSALGERHARR